MITLAVGVITSHKARGTARLQAVRRRRRRAVHMKDLWGGADRAQRATVRQPPHRRTRRRRRSLPGTVAADEVRSVIVYCKVDAEHLGAATLTPT